ncbi:MAG: tyrosine-type recombinase/integrase [Reyranella sp.]|uniref:tyrosine-type recombinase/integrase n=1 Tax=Reyranella sp. TaxID=1929291 RepID=UPI0027322311|nr:tyrosine-type recombinase/integrase [Reyranella sp.]MDP1961443.1 tyrosine-type recombinase/integrase [Reyranella sp.]MDP2377328.1 tyrosine-type recombinase/integrase [Reyranella sp.]
MTPLAPHLSDFLRAHLPRERGASQNTIASYAHCYRLLLTFAAERRKTRPSRIEIEDLDANLICAFLDHLEAERSNTPRSRNARLAAIHSLFRYIEYRVPACLEQARRIHAIPMKRSAQPLVGYLTRAEMQSLLAAPDPRTVAGLRDLAMLHLAFAAGLRVSELVGLGLEQFDDAAMPSLHVIGKGRRERILPLWQETARTLRRWIAVRSAQGDPQLFLNAAGRKMTRSGFEYILRKHAAVAAKVEPSIGGKRVTPHVLRHSCAMHTLQATGDVRKVSLWLGHASVQTTEMYLRADPTEKLEALTAMGPPTLQRGRFTVPDKLMAMLTEASNGRNYAE